MRQTGNEAAPGQVMPAQKQEYGERCAITGKSERA